MKTKISNYNYILPSELIAAASANPRDTSRLLVFETKKNKIFNKRFYQITDFLKPGDLIINNNSKVMPARIFGKKKTGGKIEVLLLENNDNIWQVLVGGKVNNAEEIFFEDKLSCNILEKNGREARVEFSMSGADFWRTIEKIGHIPIPPYIKNSKLSEGELRREYQTVYAKKYGSAAAPTAGLHFTKKLIGDLETKGIEFASIDLHVGLGTFAPISSENIELKKLHKENFIIPSSTIRKILSVKKSGGRIFAVGTTTVRAVESSVSKILSGEKEISGSTDIFIQPGDDFKIIDGLITNLHLPQSSLMMLVAAFIQNKGVEDGREKLLEIYKQAIDNRYRFYSFGDGMLII